MNTEPPEGDDLQRMLVSMKQNVLERATPRPKRRRFRPGIALGVIGLLAIGTATGAVALSLSQQETPVAAPTRTQQPEPSPSATTPTSAPITQRPTPRPTPVNTTATIPTDCRALVPSSDYDRFFGETPLVQIKPSLPDTPEEYRDLERETGDDISLRCVWRDPQADVTGLGIMAGESTPEAISENLAVIRGEGGTCSERDHGTVCQTVSNVEPYDVDRAYTYYTRGTAWVVIDQTNFPTDNLLGAIVGEIWGD
ncbi:MULTISPECIES: hypothetical protein [unclassified Curtobacterium]|uniref:hypothetical protein n=1 Tax=unclassified Curtobacterium TaxID=257496 RepID=UPI0008F0D4F4|nr:MULTISPECIES: hypothetical protein [unclassified Curtobacterium]MCT9622149.1 hypothetical protein [Curtobacterium sp. C2H10]SFF45800.1 hypothetical protein SAMN05216329_0943 [Curtobacterium sp. YR515]